MDKEPLKFDDVEIEKRKFHFSKSPTEIHDVDVNKVTLLTNFIVVKKVLSILSATNMIK